MKPCPESTIPLACDICGAPMTMKAGTGFLGDEAAFTCTGSSCRQYLTVARNGRVGFTIMGRLYPNNMAEGGALHREFVAYKIGELAFRNRARVLAGYMTRETADRQVKELREVNDAYLARLPLPAPPTPPRRWWQFWTAP